MLQSPVAESHTKIKARAQFVYNLLCLRIYLILISVDGFLVFPFFFFFGVSSKLYAYKYGSAIKLIATLRLPLCFRFRFGRSIMGCLVPRQAYVSLVTFRSQPTINRDSRNRHCHSRRSRRYSTRTIRQFASSFIIPFVTLISCRT